MADAKISALTAVTLPAAADLIAIVDDPAGTPATKKITHDDLLFGANTTPVTQAHGDSASVGNSLDAARANHVHGMPSVGEGAAKAWCRIDTDGTLTAPDLGIGSVDDDGAGDRTPNFTTVFSDADYTVEGLVSDSANATQRPSNLAVGSVRIRVEIADTTLTDLRHSLTFHGAQ